MMSRPRAGAGRAEAHRSPSRGTTHGVEHDPRTRSPATTMMDNYAIYFNLSGLALVLVGCIGLVSRAFRNWRKGLAPLGLIALGLALIAFPAIFRLVVPIDLGPRERIVDGRRHITLTGWDRTDYGWLGSKRDVAVLQMANPDVTDETLQGLRGMDRLTELDISNTAVTDAGLAVLKDLPALATLRLKNTRVTDAGFKSSLAGKESLMQLDLSKTEVSKEAVDEWKKARAGRRALR
ncbi:hypothetical protein OJF2_44370 [Aquisphaera giovannonii]|uniref:Leucine Rich repeats (2 copies) n=1 Tax=Aquisphaera giovannonii TaxID=406548 RepID=A0A5B9W7H6_9BACT|nr:hypothetical protein [Aquisphaera giovannonii]QEH35880.1 hypothetical protein OJF2_44370 [Aquisphaera giovannonii]